MHAVAGLRIDVVRYFRSTVLSSEAARDLSPVLTRPAHRIGSNQFVLAISRFRSKRRPHKERCFGFALTHWARTRQEFFGVAACDQRWKPVESRGRLLSIEHALLFAREEWGVPVAEWILCDPTEGTPLVSTPTTAFERTFMKARSRILVLLKEFKYDNRTYRKGLIARGAQRPPHGSSDA